MAKGEEYCYKFFDDIVERFLLEQAHRLSVNLVGTGVYI